MENFNGGANNEKCLTTTSDANGERGNESFYSALLTQYYADRVKLYAGCWAGESLNRRTLLLVTHIQGGVRNNSCPAVLLSGLVVIPGLEIQIDALPTRWRNIEFPAGLPAIRRSRN